MTEFRILQGPISPKERSLTCHRTGSILRRMRDREFPGKLLPELVVFDQEGHPEGLRYRALIPMLLNEIQGLHRRLEVLEQNR